MERQLEGGDRGRLRVGTIQSVGTIRAGPTPWVSSRPQICPMITRAAIRLTPNNAQQKSRPGKG